MFEYFAAPHTHDNRAVRTIRYIIITHVASRLMLEGRPIYSPISASHHMDLMQRGAIKHEHWIAADIQVLRHAGRILFLELEGHLESRGMNHERDWAMQLHIPTEAIDPTLYANPRYLAVHHALLHDETDDLGVEERAVLTRLKAFDSQLSVW